MITASSWFSRFWSGCLRGPQRGGAWKQRAGSQPRLEPLEGRVALSGGYTFTDLGTLGGRWSWPVGLNDRGQVVGWSLTADNDLTHPFVDSRGKMKSLRSFLGGESAATGINDRGQIVGYSQNTGPTSETEVFLYSHGRMKGIGEPSEVPSVVSINNRDQVIGLSSKAGDAERLKGGRLTDLGSLAGLGSVALGINDRGMVVGYSLLTVPRVDPFPPIIRPGGVTLPIEPITPMIEHAFIYRHGRMTDLGTLGGSSSQAVAINNHGNVVGWSDTTGDLSKHAFLDRKSRMIDLGTLGGSESGATAINDRGQVVGWSQVAGTGQTDQFLYSHGKMVDLNALFPTLGPVMGINNRGQIVGVSTNADGEEVAVLLTPR
jgi:probable HAF family extracellular repeat protein